MFREVLIKDGILPYMTSEELFKEKSFAVNDNRLDWYKISEDIEIDISSISFIANNKDRLDLDIIISRAFSSSMFNKEFFTKMETLFFGGNWKNPKNTFPICPTVSVDYFDKYKIVAIDDHTVSFIDNVIEDPIFYDMVTKSTLYDDEMKMSLLMIGVAIDMITYDVIDEWLSVENKDIFVARMINIAYGLLDTNPNIYKGFIIRYINEVSYLPIIKNNKEFATEPELLVGNGSTECFTPDAKQQILEELKQWQ